MNIRTALITGGGRRVGRAIALHLAKRGWDVAITFHGSQAEAADTVAQIETLGRAALAIKADLTTNEACDEVAKAVLQWRERLDLLVNNASIYEPSKLGSGSIDRARAMWALHVESPWLLCQRLWPALKSARGSVVNMVDLLAERPWPAYALYSASKAALANLTLSLAREMAPEVRVNGIAPGVVEWPEEYPEPDRQRYLSRVPLARPGLPADVAELVQYLADQSYLTGQIIRLDGGRSIT